MNDLPWPVGALQVFNREIYRLLDDGSYFHCAHSLHLDDDAIHHPKLKTVPETSFLSCPRYYMIAPVRDPTSGDIVVGK